MSPSLVPKPDDWKNHIGMNQKNNRFGNNHIDEKGAFFRCSGILFP